MANRNWSNKGGATTGATIGAQTWYERNIVHNYAGVFLVTILAAAGITFLEVMFSKAGGTWSIVNYWIGWGCLAAWAFLVFHPKGPGPVLFLAVMGFNAPWNELDDILTKLKLPDFKLREMGEKGWEFLRTKYFVLAGHVALYLVLQSMILATFDVSRGALIPGILLGLAGFGLWAALLTKAVVWYARIVFLVLIVTTGFAAAGAFAPEPSATEVVAEEVRAMSDANLDKRNAKQVEALKAFVENGGVLTPEQQATIDQAASETSRGNQLLKQADTFFRGRVIEYQVPSNIAPENLKPICGIPPGEHTISVSEGSRLLINAGGTMVSEPLTGPAHTISRPDQLHRSDYRPFGLMINGGGDGEKIVVNKKGCIVVSFNTIFAQDDAFRTGEWKAEPSTILFRLQPE